MSFSPKPGLIEDTNSVKAATSTFWAFFFRFDFPNCFATRCRLSSVWALELPLVPYPCASLGDVQDVRIIGDIMKVKMLTHPFFLLVQEFRLKGDNVNIFDRCLEEWVSKAVEVFINRAPAKAHLKFAGSK